MYDTDTQDTRDDRLDRKDRYAKRKSPNNKTKQRPATRNERRYS